MEHPPQFNITQSELNPIVSDYFGNLLAQRDAILARYGLTPETAEQFCDLRSTDEDREKMFALYEKILYVIENKKFNYVVPSAPNPFVDAFKQAGLPDDHPLCLEKKEMTLDMPEIIAFHIKHYRSHGMEAWADDIEQHINQLYDHLSSSGEQQRIELRIKAGYIPIIMPGRGAQFDSCKMALNHLKPVHIKGGVKQEIEPFISDCGADEMIETITAPHSNCFRSTPESPYILWAKPMIDLRETDAEWQTTNLSYDNQVIILETLHADNPELCDEMDMNPLEYAALQSISSHAVEQQSIDAGYEPVSINPLDHDTFTRFIGVGRFEDRKVFGGVFIINHEQMYFGFDNGVEDVRCGFRPVARS